MEISILYALQSIHNGILNQIMIYISSLGNKGLFWVLIAIILIVFRKDKKCGIAMLIALILSLLFGNVILKHLVARSRPCWVDTNITLLISNPTDYSFPSGHTFSSFAAATVMYLYNKKTGIIALFLAGLIGFSRLYLFVHYPTDVIAGALFGIGVALIATLLVNKYYKYIAATGNRLIKGI